MLFDLVSPCAVSSRDHQWYPLYHDDPASGNTLVEEREVGRQVGGNVRHCEIASPTLDAQGPLPIDKAIRSAK